MDFTRPVQLSFDTKVCNGCGEAKPLSDYYLKTTGRPFGRCKPCYLTQQIENKRIRVDPALLAERERAKEARWESGERTCTGCFRLLPFDAFYKRTDAPDKPLSRCKECQAATDREYAKTHEVRLKGRRAKWMQEKHAERLENTRRWRARNKEHRREYNRRFNALNPEPNRARVKRWVANNPDKAKDLHRLRKARVKGAGGSFSTADWERLKAHYDWRCLACGVQEPDVVLQADHVVPLAIGGWNIISNIQPLCPHHNNSKNSKFIDYRPDFWKVERIAK